MAVVYFTSNASTGAGSLVEAIKNASPGDVIRPDETVFERGSTIEIVLAASLTLDKNLTLDGGPFRVRLNGDGRSRCVALADNANVEMTAFDIVGGGWNSQTNADVGSAPGAGLYVPSGSGIALNRCGFFGCRGTYGGGVSVGSGATATLNDCVIVGCYARGSGAGLRSLGDVVVSGSTIIGNIAPTNGVADVLVDGSGSGRVTFANSIVGKYRGNVEIGDGCVVGVASSQIGFVASPPDDFSVDNWTANAWQNWDLRLLDDASGAPSPYRDSGDVGTMSRYDLDGNFRGRETNGVATCSPGAYETIQADLFWVGRDATGAEVVSPSFLTSDGWAASRFATASGDVAPQNVDVVFIDGDVSFDGCGLALTRLIVGGCAAVRFAASGTQTLTATFFDVGVGATIESTAGTQKLGVRDSSSASRFGDYAYVKLAFSSSSNRSFQIAQTARFSDLANAVVIYREGFFGYYRLNLYSATIDRDVENVGHLVCSASSGRVLTATNSPRIVCKRFEWYRASSESASASALTEGSTPLIIEASELVKITGDVLPSDCRVDVSRTTPDGSLSLTLTGQTVYGDASSSAVLLTGSATVDERGLASQSLTLNAAATLNVDGGLACVGELTVADGASVAFSSERGDAVLTATESATVGGASFAGVGYFATPSGTDLTAATIDETVRRAEVGASVETFAATATGPTTAKLEWSATDATKPVYIERQNATAPNGWETIAVASTAEASPLTVALTGRERFRVFDGQTFRVDAAWFPTQDFFVYVADDISAVATEQSEWTTVTQTIKAGGAMCYRNENVMFMARVKNRLSGEWLAPSDVVAITATLCRVYENGFAPDEWTPVPGWENVEVPAECLLESPTANEAWTVDGEGPNFVWVPDVRERPFFPTGGKFATQLRFELTGGRNPVYLTFVDDVG